MLIKVIITTANVVVLTPPPVEVGEAPINISANKTNSVELNNAPVSKTLNPAVRGVAAVKKAVNIFPATVKLPIVA